MKISIPPEWENIYGEIKKIVRELREDAYIVGGFVRDLIMKKLNPLDMDVLFLDEKGRINFIKKLSSLFGRPQLIRDGEVHRFLIKEKIVDVVEPKGKNLDEDARNRDFTINAVYMNILSEQIIDPLGGIRDMEEKLGRTCSVPEKTFSDDPGRIIRMVRIFEEQEIKPAEGVIETSRSMKSLLLQVQGERIGDEMEKIILSEKVREIFLRMRDLGLINYIVPELLDSIGHEQKTPYHFEDTFSHSIRVTSLLRKDLSLRLAGLFHDAGKPNAERKKDDRFLYAGHEKISAELLDRACFRWGVEKNVRKMAKNLVLHHMVCYTPEWSDKAVRRFIKRTEGFRKELLEFMRADISARSDYEKGESLRLLDELEGRIKRELEKTPEEKMKSPLNGYEIMAILNIPPGPLVGKIKQELQNLVVDGELSPDDRESALKIIRKIYKEKANI